VNNLLSNKAVIIFGIIVYFYVFIVTLANIYSGSMAFWYDPARDLLLAIGNLQNPTLIGPPAGIPGIFYGPYWIWMLSIALLVSKDPRIVTLIVLFLPYFILLPLLLWGFAKKWGITTSIIIGTLLLLHFNTYTKQLWNPHPAPLLFLIVSYLLATSNFVSNKRKDIAVVMLTGFIAGLLVNFHISFGIGMVGGLTLFFILDCIRAYQQAKQHKSRSVLRYLVSVLFFGLGAFVAYLPFLLFEVRHGFNQIQAAYTALTSSGAVVGLRGLNDMQIVSEFIKTFYRLTGFTTVLSVIGVLIVIANIFYLKTTKQNIKLSVFDVRIVLLVMASAIAIATLYLTSKNPVWNYHFIGVEVIFLLMIGVVSSKLSFIRYFLLSWVFILFLWYIPTTLKGLSGYSFIEGTLAAKEAVVEQVIADSAGKEYGIVAYNPAIYTYDYDYLFLWKGNKKLAAKVGEVGPVAPTYIIVPSENSPKVQDYMNAQTRNLKYSKLKEWKIGNTKVIKVQVKDD
jgi:hypothetical protein